MHRSIWLQLYIIYMGQARSRVQKTQMLLQGRVLSKVIGRYCEIKSFESYHRLLETSCTYKDNHVFL